MKAAELKKDTLDELKKRLLSLHENQSQLRMQGRTGQVSHYHRFKEIRRDIARIKTVLAEKKNRSQENE